MEAFRPFQAAVATRSLALAVVAAAALALFHQRVPALALLAGTIISLFYQWHIARSFDRLADGGKRYLPFNTIETLLRVLVAGAAPFFIVGRGPWQGYFTYLAGFVAPLAVAILVYKKQISTDCVPPGAPDDHPARTTAS